MSRCAILKSMKGTQSAGTRVLLIAVVLMAAVSGQLFSLDLPGFDLFGGIQWMGNAEEEGGPSPLMGVWGVGLPLEFSRLISLEPELSMFGTQYQLTSGGVKSVPTEIEYAHSLWFLSLMLDVPLRFTFRINEALALGAGPHLAFLFRIPTIGWGDASARTGDRDHRAAIVAYLYSNVKFLYPGTDLFLSWQFAEKLGFFFRIVSYFPLFHAWDGEAAPFWDQFFLSFRVGVRFSF